MKFFLRAFSKASALALGVLAAAVAQASADEVLPAKGELLQCRSIDPTYFPFYEMVITTNAELPVWPLQVSLSLRATYQDFKFKVEDRTGSAVEAPSGAIVTAAGWTLILEKLENGVIKLNLDTESERDIELTCAKIENPPTL
jgi:hypothetical protein